MRKYILISLILGNFIGFLNVLEGKSQDDPLDRLNYNKAFNQKKLHEKFKVLMKKLGCDKNVFDKDSAISTTVKPTKISKADFNDDIQHSLSSNNDQKEIRKYERECLNQLYWAKNWAIIQPAGEDATTILLCLLACSILIKIIGKESMGGSLGILNLFSYFALMSKELIGTCYSLIFKSEGQLDTLEEFFAKNQCFIPKNLWPIIIEKFMVGRTNQFDQGKCINFLKFILGFTSFKPKVNQSLSNARTSILKELNCKIDSFFENYEEGTQKTSCVFKIKKNISKFIDSLIINDGKDIRYICLSGPGGIGKTYFVKKLHKWLEELLPNCVELEELVITSSSELEGNDETPGALLRTLQKQLSSNKIGSLIFFDEARWLSEGDLISAAKRVFNGNQSKLFTSYFGRGIDGKGVDLQMPPFLIFVAMNEDINDPALKSRFDFINYPMPKLEALSNYALELANNSKLLKQAAIKISKSSINEWIESLARENRTFRYIEANIEEFFLINYQAPGERRLGWTLASPSIAKLN